ncbi:hypothetical protein [Saccharopolyspora flava]|uniref:hypothetical protein n=1 Tax=Saccharopolyspora flava TaxID=95161 RepID=UPI000B81C4D9|nr:hypothetical protein [Saccharopolyspora flava]
MRSPTARRTDARPVGPDTGSPSHTAATQRGGRIARQWRPTGDDPTENSNETTLLRSMGYNLAPN